MLGLNWGASLAERAAPLPCDELLPDAGTRCDRALSVDAPAAVLFRWLCQLRVAPYSYDLLDNLGRRSPRELTPGLERLEVGQRFMSIFALASFAIDDHVTLRSPGIAVTYAVRSHPDHSRLVARVLFKTPGGRLGHALIGRTLALGDAVMMRKQLLTLKELAEEHREVGTAGVRHASAADRRAVWLAPGLQWTPSRPSRRQGFRDAPR